MVRALAHDRLDKRNRLRAIRDRDGNRCFWCHTAFAECAPAPTTEHLVPRLKGGPSWIENEVAACAVCNRKRGHMGLGAWVVQCQQRGWPVEPAAVLERLTDLQSAIKRRGGQRRARAYIASQRRRLQRMLR